MPRFIVVIISLAFLFLLIPAVVFAHAPSSSRIDLTISQGPGWLLPVSPFYFMDVLKNNVLLFITSYNRGEKAKVHLAIAGERIAEIKVMLEEKNITPRSLDIALASLSEHIDGARTELKLEKGSGKNVELLANQLDITINSQKESLHILQAKTDEEGSLKIAAKLAKISEIEVEIEDEMAADIQRNEAVRELTNVLDDERQEASRATSRAASLEVELSKRLTLTESIKSAKPQVAGAATESSIKK